MRSSLVVTWKPSLHLWHTIGQDYYIGLQRETYYSSQVSRLNLCSLCISRSVSAINGWHDHVERCECEFHAMMIKDPCSS